MIGRTISHYRIVRELGSGGMGVVFAAEDVRLGRQVAIKFVPDGLPEDRLLFERLRSEARTASALNHPNICTLYDIGDHDGRPFIVMELLQGRTLRERLGAGPLKMDETLEIGIQVADALDAAHREHIIHRDIKPANLFLNDRGSIKILDFGLAKVVSHQPSALTTAPTDLTGAGMTLGTVSYMSPEQVTGDPLDGRSDIFSFGVVLYECVTGHQPFKGKTSGVILSEILNRTPPAPLAFNPDLPLRLQEIITNCLEKDRGLRYQDAAALRTDLKRLRRDLESGPRSTSRIDLPQDTSSSGMQASAVTSAPIQRAPSATGTAGDAGRHRGVGLVIAAVLIVSTAAAIAVFRASTAPATATAPLTPPTPRGATPEADTDAPPPAPLATPPAVSSPPPDARKPDPAPLVSASPAPRTASTQAAPVAAPPAAPTTAPPPPTSVAALPPIATTPPIAPSDVPRPIAVAPAASAPAAVVTPAEDDDVAIRRVLTSYARAIESKDIDAFKAVKPNLSAADQRRLEDSFRAVASQKVDLNVLGIDRRGSTAVVRVKRRDTLTAGGRSQTSESQQTMTLIRSGAGWVISEIGR